MGPVLRHRSRDRLVRGRARCGVALSDAVIAPGWLVAAGRERRRHRFPPGSVDFARLKPTWMRSLCPWKGIASYYTIEARGERNRDAAWSYRHPFPWVRKIRGHVAFWNGVQIRT